MTLIIAEAGVNHNGNEELAFQLIDEAFKAGADIVKFQTFKAKDLVTSKAQKAAYQVIGSSANESQLEMLSRLELSHETHHKLIAHCKQLGIEFMSTAFDSKSLDFLINDLGLTRLKIPSGEITNLPYLRKIASQFPEVILSTGMADIKEVNEAVEILLRGGVDKNKLTVLHCNTEYPTPMKDVNLKAMFHIKEEVGVNVGYSDHTLGVEVPVAAVALGAKVIEKHFTLDRNMEGPDHRASLEPNELKLMVNSIRNIEKALSGSGIKEPSVSESKNKGIVRKSIVAIQPIQKGEMFKEANIGVKRPGTGISPMRWYDIIGQTSSKDFNVDDIIVL